MSFLQLVRREMHGSLPKLLFMSGLGGISTAAILGAINSGLQNGSTLWAATLFIVALFLFIKTQSYVTITTTAEIEAIIHKNSRSTYGPDQALGAVGARRRRSSTDRRRNNE